MSGFEVVGVVLGTLPLAISALEHYRDGLRVIQRWRKYERELQSLIRNLETERAKLQNVCEMLLTGLVSNSQIEAMVDDPLGDLWLEEGIRKKVRVRLWRSWNIFEKNLQEMNAAIDRLMDALGDTSKLNNPKASSVSIVRELKRATFAIDRSAYVDLLTTIRDGVSNLESLTSSNITLEPERRVRSRLRLLSIIRDVSVGLYRATRSSFTQCTCRHDVGLRLSTYSGHITPGDDNETVTQRLKFYAALSHESEVLGRSLPVTKKRLWDEVTVQVVPWPSQSRLAPPTPEGCPSSTPRDRRLRSVRFSSFQSSPWFRSSTSITETTVLATTQMACTPVLNSTSIPASEEGADLCKGYKTSKAQIDRTYPTKCYGRVYDKLSPTQSCFAVYPCSQPTDDNYSKMISLRDVLDPKTEIHMQPLSRRDRLQLAVFVASSVLQLYSTPWLPDLLTSNNVFFLIREGFTTSPDSEHAFVIASSGPPSLPGQQPQTTATTKSSTALPVEIRNPTLLSLGILLIEIISGQTIDAMRIPDDSQKEFTINSANTDTNVLLADYMVARRLLSQVYEASSNYGSAVRRCINGDFQRQRLDLNDEGFREEVYSGVVSLLEEDLSHT